MNCHGNVNIIGGVCSGKCMNFKRYYESNGMKMGNGYFEIHADVYRPKQSTTGLCRYCLYCKCS